MVCRGRYEARSRKYRGYGGNVSPNEQFQDGVGGAISCIRCASKEGRLLTKTDAIFRCHRVSSRHAKALCQEVSLSHCRSTTPLT